jgi:hypothetical protein
VEHKIAELRPIIVTQADDLAVWDSKRQRSSFGRVRVRKGKDWNVLLSVRLGDIKMIDMTERPKTVPLHPEQEVARMDLAGSRACGEAG